MRSDNNTLELPESYEALCLLYRQVCDENKRLKQLLETHYIPYRNDIPEDCSLQETPADDVSSEPSITESSASTQSLSKRSPLNERISLFLALFHGRADIYARQWRGKDGKTGYSPACKNEWQRGICGKPKVKCANCPNAEYLPYDATAVDQHLSGSRVLGVYPLYSDDTCHFLAIDFDEASWKTDVMALRAACFARGIPCAVEISRSGNGAHFWLFFDEPIQASLARSFGSMLLTQSMQENARLKFSSYDRMFPNQDTMPKGGFGNLIALPFQREAYQNGGSIFVDESLTPYPDQWTFLSSIQRIGRSQINVWMAQEHTPPLGDLHVDEPMETDGSAWSAAKPWVPIRRETPMELGLPQRLRCTMADRIYIPTEALSQKAQNHIKRLAAFRNPEFYKAQAMRMPVWNKPRVICCAEYEDSWLCLPRGCREALDTFATDGDMKLEWEDARYSGRSIDVCFRGTLREEQQLAFDALISHEEGVLSATTAFGKTVIGAALIGQRKVNTLILVHRTQLMQQWKERLSEFLDIHEVLPEMPKKRGRKKLRDLVGQYGDGKDTRSGVIDIAILQSMGKADEIKPWIFEYGMVIIDECHHVPAVSFEQVLKKVRARTIYGLTATPTRQDGHHPILNMYLGSIRYQVDAKAQAEKRPFTHVMIPRFTGARFSVSAKERMPPIGQYYVQILSDELRNHLIVDDVLTSVKEGRNCLLLSERTEHIKLLAELLGRQIDGVLTLTGGKTGAEASHQREALKDTPQDRPMVICATGKYIGEGFDEPRLDTLFLTMPISWHGTLAQYAGRLHRLHAGKREVRVYDYIDSGVEMLERMYHKRLKGYAAIGYHVAPDAADMAVGSDMIYNQDNFQKRFFEDIVSARESILIVSPYATLKRVRWLEGALGDAKRRAVSVTICTRPASAFQGRSKDAAETAIAALEALGVDVKCKTRIHQKFAVIDSRIVWYGSINLLSFGASQESIMRLVSGSVAEALRKNGEKLS